MFIVLLVILVLFVLGVLFRDSLVELFARPDGPEPASPPRPSIARHRPAWTSGPSVYEDAWVIGQDLEGCYWGDFGVSADALYFFPVGRLIDKTPRNDASVGRVAGLFEFGIAGAVVGGALGAISDASKGWKLEPGPQGDSHVLDSSDIPDDLDHAMWEEMLRRLHLSRGARVYRSSRYAKPDISSIQILDGGVVSFAYGINSLTYSVRLAKGATADNLREELAAHNYNLLRVL